MNTELAEAIAQLLRGQSGRPVRVVSTRDVGGGCINRAQLIELSDGRRVFAKFNPDPLPQLFQREAEGLTALAAAGALRVPQVLGVADDNATNTPFIVMEHIAQGRPTPTTMEQLGRGLAQLHRKTQAPSYGFAHDNYLGSTPQPNAWTQDWTEFWRDHRLGYQLALARERGLCDREMSGLGDRLLTHLDDLISAPQEPPCLLHGDLWGGNYLVDENSKPVLIDPATYYGRREADLAMTLLFGGFDNRFYAAYEETWPLATDSSTRLEVYKLYHLLNHLNLFGTSYRSACMGILTQLR